MAVTVALAAGFINAGIVFLQLTFPLLVVFLLVAVLPLENNAITWSVVGRQLQGSFWPLILGADSTSSSKVKTRVLVFSAGSTIGLILLAIAAVLTPLGLYQSVSEGEIRNTSFVYIPDLSPLGRATRSREDYKASRLCGGMFAYYNCPGQEHGFTFFRNASGEYIHDEDDKSWISSVPPANLSEIFGSGHTGNLSTVASSLDLQYRSYLQINNLEQNSSLGLGPSFKQRIDQYRKRSVGRFSTFQSFILRDDWVIVDGIIADMKTGGVAFRNHTVPETVGAGAEWTESLLWIEPQSACVNMNLSMKWTIPDGTSGGTVGGSIHPLLVDDGGIVNLTRDYPYLDLNFTQKDPLLAMRAYKGAIITNFNVMRYFNTSRNASFVGKTYAAPSKVTWGSGQLFFDRFKDGTSSFQLANDLYFLAPGMNSSRDDQRFLSPKIPVWGVGGGDLATITTVVVDGGILLGAAVSDDGGSDGYRAEPGSRWRAPFFSCVSTLKASILDVTFAINGTPSLDNLIVKHAEPRKYSTNATTPLWAVENTGLNISNISPVWGMVDDKYEHTPTLWTLRKESLYLPAGKSQYWSVNGALSAYDDDAWGPGLAQGALASVFSCGMSTSCSNMQEYTGRVNYPIFLRWQNLTQHASTAGKIFDLIWTDVMINYVTSGRSKLTIPGTDSTNEGVRNDSISAMAAIFIHNELVQYHIWYGIPGIIFLICYVAIVITSVFLLVFRRATFATLRSLSNQTAVGRAMTIERYNGKYHVQQMSTKTWIELHGDSDLLIKKDISTRLDEKPRPDDEQNANDVELTAPMLPKHATR